jgi:hypothetical protein
LSFDHHPFRWIPLGGVRGTAATAPGSIAIDDHPLEFEAEPTRHRVVVDIVIGENGAETMADIDRNASGDIEADATRRRRATLSWSWRNRD